MSRPPSRSPPRTLADTKLSAADFDSVRRFVSASLSAGLCPLVSAADMTWRTVRRCSPREVRRCSPQTSIWRTPADVHRCPADSESVRGGKLSAVGTAHVSTAADYIFIRLFSHVRRSDIIFLDYIAVPVDVLLFTWVNVIKHGRPAVRTVNIDLPKESDSRAILRNLELSSLNVNMQDVN